MNEKPHDRYDRFTSRNFTAEDLPVELDSPENVSEPLGLFQLGLTEYLKIKIHNIRAKILKCLDKERRTG